MFGLGHLLTWTFLGSLPSPKWQILTEFWLDLDMVRDSSNQSSINMRNCSAKTPIRKVSRLWNSSIISTLKSILNGCIIIRLLTGPSSAFFEGDSKIIWLGNLVHPNYAICQLQELILSGIRARNPELGFGYQSVLITLGSPRSEMRQGWRSRCWVTCRELRSLIKTL